MLFKLLTTFLALMLVAESVYILMHRLPANNRFRPVEGYEGIAAFDTATGELCKTIRTKFAVETEQSEAVAAQKLAPCPPPPKPSGDPVSDEIIRATISKRCGGNGQEVTRKSEADSTLEFVSDLPACADIR